MKRPSAMAAVDKIEEMRKPEDFVGHRNRGSEGALPRDIVSASMIDKHCRAL